METEPIIVSVKGMEIIEYLDAPSDEWLPVTQFHATAITTLEKKGLLISNFIDKKRVAKLTTLGRETRFDVIVQFTPEYYQYLASRNGHSDSEPPPVNGGGIEQYGDTCDTCIHREVLDVIAAKYPKVAALRDAMLEQRKLMEELGL